MQNFVKIGETVMEIGLLQFFDFQDGGRPPSWIRGANFGTTYKEYLVVFISVQNLVGIASVVVII